jgi:hypothetical protein
MFMIGTTNSNKMEMYSIEKSQVKCVCVYDLFLPGKFCLSVVDNIVVVHNLKAQVIG